MGLQTWDFDARLLRFLTGYLDTVLYGAKHLLLSWNSSFPLIYVYDSDEQESFTRRTNIYRFWLMNRCQVHLRCAQIFQKWVFLNTLYIFSCQSSWSASQVDFHLLGKSDVSFYQETVHEPRQGAVGHIAWPPLNLHRLTGKVWPNIPHPLGTQLDVYLLTNTINTLSPVTWGTYSPVCQVKNLHKETKSSFFLS